jgi:hypothetical protein
MASDSLFGGDIDGGGSVPGGVLDSSDRALLDALLADFVGGPAIDFDGGKLLSGDGPGGEKQGALTPGTGELEGPITNGDITMEVDIPAGTGITFTGKDGQTPDAAESYLNTAIGGYFAPNVDPNSDAGQQQQSLTGAVDDLLGSLGGGKDVSVRLVDFLGKTSPGSSAPLTTAVVSGGSGADTFTMVDGSAPQAAGVAPNEIFFDAGSSKGKQVFALNMTKIDTSKTLVIKNIEAALVAGPGNLRVDGTAATRVNSDNFAQNITGGGGNDTLVGGGNDTLTGGVGADVFGFTSAAKGKFTITDFNKTTDQIGLKLTGVTTFAQLQAAVTGGSYANGAMTYNLGPDISITLVGINPFDITADMIKFTY